MLTVICSLSDQVMYDRMLGPSLKRADELLTSMGLPKLEVVFVSGNESIFRNYHSGELQAHYPIKVFVHQDVDLMDPSWVFKVVGTFMVYPNTGLVGFVGTAKLLDRGMWWESGREYIYGELFSGEEKANWVFNVVDHPVVVQCVDSLCMATNRDVFWDANMNGFHCCDMDYSREFTWRGLEIRVIPHKVWHIGAIRDSKPDMIQFYTKWDQRKHKA